MYRIHELIATAGAGSAGTAFTVQPVAGVVHSVHFEYGGTVTTTDATLSAKTSAAAIIARSNSVTDATFYPSVAYNDGTAGARAAFTAPVFVDYLQLTVAQAGVGETVKATVVVEE